MTALSAGGQAVEQNQSQSRQNAAETQDLIDQQRLQSQGAGAVQRETQQIAQSNPDQIAQSERANFVQQLRRNAAGSMAGGATSGAPTLFGAPTSAVGSTAGADPRFGKMLTNDQQQVQDYGNTYSDELSNMDAAVRQRQNEGLGLETLGTNLNRLDVQSYGDNFVNGLRAQAAAQTNPWATLATTMLQRGAQAYAANAGTPADKAGVTGVQAPYYNTGVNDPAAARAAYLNGDGMWGSS
jgi:hypothetical protein